MIDQDLIQRIEKCKEDAQNSLPPLRLLIENIIVQRSQNIIEIEHTLDTLMDYALLGLGESEFRRLNSYYESVNKNNADFYRRSYQDMLDL